MGLEVNADRTTYVFLSGDQNEEGIHNIKIDSRAFDSVQEFK